MSRRSTAIFTLEGRATGCSEPRDSQSDEGESVSSFWDVIFWMVWLSLLATWIGLIIKVMGDLFSDPEVGGGAKAMWTLLMLFLPWIGPLIYLTVRGNAMNRRALESGDMPVSR